MRHQSNQDPIKKGLPRQEQALQIRSIPDSIISIKQALLSGKSITLIDFPEQDRPAALAALSVIRDELPVHRRWKTIRESFKSETRLRAVEYWIPGQYLHDEGQP